MSFNLTAPLRRGSRSASKNGGSGFEDTASAYFSSEFCTIFFFFAFGLMAILASPAAQSNSARVDSGLVAYYPFNEGSGKIAVDQSGYGSPMNLDLEGAVSWSSTGNGVVMSGGRVGTIGPATKIINALRSSNTSSFEIWVQPENIVQAGPSRMISIATDGRLVNRNYMLGQDRDNIHIRLKHSGKSSDKPRLTTGDGPLDTGLVHIVHTYDGAVERLYVNGVAHSKTVVDSGNYSVWSDHSLSIGNIASNDRPYAGTIQLVAIYDRALNPAEIQQNYSAGTSASDSGVADTTPPSIPGSLSASLTSTGQVQLDWQASQDDTAMLRYLVYRDSVFAGQTTVETTYVDAGAASGTEHEYSVSAVDTSLNESDFAIVSILTPVSVANRTSSGLVALYPFNEGAGATALDQSGIGTPMNLELTGAVSWSNAGNGVVMSGGRVGTSGAATRVIDALRASNASTFEAWVHPSNVSQQGPTRMIAIAANTSQRNYLLGQEKDEVQVRLRHTGKNTDKPHLITTNGPLGNKLMHVVHTYDGTVERLYVDGVLQSSQVASVGSYSNWYTNHRLSIGNEASNDRPFAGLIQLVAIYDRALDSSEVELNFGAGPNGGESGSNSGSNAGSGSGGDGSGSEPDNDGSGAGSEDGSGSTEPSTLTLSWSIPSKREDGKALPLSDLDHYQIFAAAQSGVTSVFMINDPATTSYVLTGLSPGTYQLSMLVVDQDGVQSRPSGAVFATVN